MGRTYKLGRRFHRTKYLCIVAELLIIYIFHFLYQMLFPGINQFVLGVCFALAAVLAAFGTYQLLNWFGRQLAYQITDQGLSIQRGRAAKLYPWSEFTAAGVESLNILSRLPVYFQLKDGRRLQPEPYLEGLGSLTLDVIDHIKDHADISSELLERLETARAVQQSGHKF